MQSKDNLPKWSWEQPLPFCVIYKITESRGGRETSAVDSKQVSKVTLSPLHIVIKCLQSTTMIRSVLRNFLLCQHFLICTQLVKAPQHCLWRGSKELQLVSLCTMSYICSMQYSCAGLWVLQQLNQEGCSLRDDRGQVYEKGRNISCWMIKWWDSHTVSVVIKTCSIS